MGRNSWHCLSGSCYRMQSGSVACLYLDNGGSMWGSILGEAVVHGVSTK